jgi:hypothetical protein
MLHGPALVFLLRLPETTLMVGSSTTRQGVDPVSQVLFANVGKDWSISDTSLVSLEVFNVPLLMIAHCSPRGFIHNYDYIRRQRTTRTETRRVGLVTGLNKPFALSCGNVGKHSRSIISYAYAAKIDINGPVWLRRWEIACTQGLNAMRSRR